MYPTETPPKDKHRGVSYFKTIIDFEKTTYLVTRLVWRDLLFMEECRLKAGIAFYIFREAKPCMKITGMSRDNL